MGVVVDGKWSVGARNALALTMLALLVGLVYLLEYAALPFVDGPLYDSLVYLEQARRVRLGQHADPTLLAFSPLYGYFLALFGAHAHDMTVPVVQVVLGALDLWLVGRVTTRLFGARAAPFAMAAMLLYGPLLFYQSKVLSETVGLTLLLLAIDRLAGETPRAEAWGGLLLALSVLARASLLVMLPLFVFERLRLSWRRSLVLALAILAPLVGHGIYVKARTGVFVPVILVSSTAATATRSDWTGELDTFRSKGEAHVGAFSVVDQARERLAHPEAPRPSVSWIGWLERAPMKALLTLRARGGAGSLHRDHHVELSLIGPHVEHELAQKAQVLRGRGHDLDAARPAYARDKGLVAHRLEPVETDDALRPDELVDRRVLELELNHTLLAARAHHPMRPLDAETRLRDVEQQAELLVLIGELVAEPTGNDAEARAAGELGRG